jgi:hypothetical protein
MDRNEVAVATITLASSPEDEVLLRRSLVRLADARIPAAVADDSPSAAFTDFLGTLDRFSVVKPVEPGLVRQVQASLARAASFGRRFIMYVEPDKELFFDGRMDEFLNAAPDGNDVGVVVASRSPESFQTYPPMQRYTENVINHLTGESIGCHGDYSYGPFLIDRALLTCVSGLAPRIGWGWRHFAFLCAHRRGFAVHHVTRDYPCPPDQRAEADDQRRHRLRQLSENVLGLIA